MECCNGRLLAMSSTIMFSSACNTSRNEPRTWSAVMAGCWPCSAPSSSPSSAAQAEMGHEYEVL
eukprot:1162037-Pelagomonas_calceolata.AAC.5